MTPSEGPPSRPPGDQILADAADQMLVVAANRYYVAREWAGALSLFEAIQDRNPPIAAQLAVPLGIAHCRVELAAPDALSDAPPVLVPTGEPAEVERLIRLHHRAVELCSEGAFARAAQLLRLIAPLDAAIGETYRIAIAPGATACARLAVGRDEPAFVGACGVTEARVRATRERFAGLRALLLTRHYSTTRGYEIANNLVASAQRYGLEVREAPVSWAGAESAPRYAADLLQHLVDFKPALVLFEEFMLKGLSPAGDALADQLHTVLRTARESLGIKVVRCDADAWYAAAYAPDQLYAGLGDYLDVIQHHHVAALPPVPPAAAGSVFFCPFPTLLPEPAAPVDPVPRGCFVGSIHTAGISRLVWWAESGVRGLPIDFRVTTGSRTEQMSDADYVRLLAERAFALNFTHRGTGARTLTARSIEVPLCGGVLVEEQSDDTPYFMVPGVHYAPFETLDDLAAVADGLLSDAPRRRRMAADARAWVRRYYDGDYFWTGILTRLWG